MEKKPITPELHGILDYSIAGLQMTVPEIIGMDKKARRIYQTLGTSVLANNAMTDTNVGLLPMMSMQDHKKADIGMLATMALLTFYKPIRSDKKALTFHLGMLAMSAAEFFLTDFEKDNSKSKTSNS